MILNGLRLNIFCKDAENVQQRDKIIKVSQIFGSTVESRFKKDFGSDQNLS